MFKEVLGWLFSIYKCGSVIVLLLLFISAESRRTQHYLAYIDCLRKPTHSRLALCGKFIA